MRNNKQSSMVLVLSVLFFSIPSLAGVPRNQCIGVDGRECQVLEFGVCQYSDTKEIGSLIGKNQLCEPLKLRDSGKGLVTVLSYDESARLNENMSVPTGQKDEKQCNEYPKVDGLPQEVWNQAQILESSFSDHFWIQKMMRDNDGECAISLYPIIQIVHPDVQQKNSVGHIIFDETKPVLRIYKPQGSRTLKNAKATEKQSIVSVRTSTPGFAKVSDLIPLYHYVLESQSGEARLSTLFYGGRKYARENMDKPAPWNSHYFSTFYNFVKRYPEVNKYSSQPCLNRDTISIDTMSYESLESQLKNVDVNIKLEKAKNLTTLNICAGSYSK